MSFMKMKDTYLSFQRVIEIFSYHTLIYILINYSSICEFISSPKNEIEKVYCIECQVNRINYSHPPDFLLNDTSRIH